MATQRDLSSSTGGMTERLKQDGKQKLESSKRSAADQIDEVARALTRAGEQLNEHQPTIASYADQMASSVSRLATRLRDGNMDDLLSDTRELARRNPGMFLAGGVALGFALSRFLKASGRQAHSSEHGDYRRSEYSGVGDYTAGDFPQDPSGAAGFGGAQRGEQESTIDVESTTTYASGRSRDDYSGSRSNGG